LGDRRSAIALLPLAPLDPANGVAELLGDPDIVVLALRDMQDLVLLVAEGRLPAAVEGEELWIRLGLADLVDGDTVVKRVAEGVGVGGKGDAVAIRHGDE